MRLRVLPAAVPVLIAALPVPSAHAATRAAVVLAYTRTPSGASSEIVAFACQGGGAGRSVDYSCSVSPSSPGPIPPSTADGTVHVTGTYRITVRLHVVDVTGHGYSCSSSVELTAGTPPLPGGLHCRA